MSSCIPVLAILLSSSFFVNPQPLYNSTAIAPTSWINSPSVPSTNFSFSFARVLLLQLNPDGYGPSFAAGFYCDFCNDDSLFFSIFIVSTDSAGIDTDSFLPQVIWTANQGHPVSENATLQLTSQSGLTLRDSDGSIIWTTDVGNRSVAGINITEYGNLVLFDKDNSSIWQSWEHPTDSLVIGQSLAGGQSLIAASSINTDLTDMPYLLITLLAGGLFAFVNSDPPQLYDQIALNLNKSVDNSTFMTFANGTLKMSSMLHKPKESQVLINLGAAKELMSRVARRLV
ncbi:Serine/threonine-protein kinase [Rhynchospora pubera]|uniref:non-specific serine/threonine protein kinase n=1 Tax=Rhynchospora pubera TaxID=906938 RepID=A0AAV8DP41_9POAL|nr:Serine/threonine-protein kinase [Rhynchospora pubera]